MIIKEKLDELRIQMLDGLVHTIDSSTDEELRAESAVAALLQFACNHCSMTQEHIAKEIGTTRETVNRWTRGLAETHPMNRVNVVRVLRNIASNDALALKIQRNASGTHT